MIGRRTTVAIRILWWTVGLVILLEGSRTFSGSMTGVHEPGHAGVLAWVRLMLSGAEILAAPLFLLPVTAAVGGYALLGIIGLAITIHALHGDFRGLRSWCSMRWPCTRAWRGGRIGLRRLQRTDVRRKEFQISD
jgi:hypothetical protein